jgi:uncharacterized membrane protein YphA (DoxX/SURF4 family)
MIQIKNNPKLANLILRVGLGITVLWFGVSQLISPSEWIGFLPVWAFDLNFVSTITLVYLNGIFETLGSLAFIFNQYTKFFSILLAIHMGFIIFHLGYNDLAIRDFGILVGFLALVFMSENKGIFDKFLKKIKLLN